RRSTGAWARGRRGSGEGRAIGCGRRGVGTTPQPRGRRRGGAGVSRGLREGGGGRRGGGGRQGGGGAGGRVRRGGGEGTAGAERGIASGGKGSRAALSQFGRSVQRHTGSPGSAAVCGPGSCLSRVVGGRGVDRCVGPLTLPSPTRGAGKNGRPNAPLSRDR